MADRIADVWGERTPFISDGNWPERVDQFLTVDEDRVVFWESCEYLDGSLVVVETTLEVRGGKIVRQVDDVLLDGRTAPCGDRGANEEGEASIPAANRKICCSDTPGNHHDVVGYNCPSPCSWEWRWG